jgi:type IV secretion system protein VirB8
MSDVRAPAADRRKRYYQEGESWAADVHGALRASRRVAWTVAAVAVTVAGLEAFALAALAPLKTVVPYTITVDRQTGYVQTVEGLKPGGTLSQDQAVTQSFLVQYVLARETFDPTDLREDYRKVMLWSAGDARATYQRLMTKTAPDSPLNLYGPTTTVAVTVKSVSLLSPTTALVRFDTARHDAGGVSGPSQPWAAVLAFRYSNAPMSMGDRFINPLGFQITRYRRDAETPTGGVGAGGTGVISGAGATPFAVPGPAS